MMDAEYRKEAIRKLAHAKATKRGVFAFDEDSDECCRRMLNDGLIIFVSEETRVTWQRNTIHYGVTEAGWRFLASQHQKQPGSGKLDHSRAGILR